jgi:hypothetical protein
MLQSREINHNDLVVDVVNGQLTLENIDSTKQYAEFSLCGVIPLLTRVIVQNPTLGNQLQTVFLRRFVYPRWRQICGRLRYQVCPQWLMCPA